MESKSTRLNACMQNLLDIIAHGSKDNTVNHDIALDKAIAQLIMLTNVQWLDCDTQVQLSVT